MSKGQEAGKGHSPTGVFGHGGHHRKEFKPVSKGPETDHMVQVPPSAMPGAPMGNSMGMDE